MQPSPIDSATEQTPVILAWAPGPGELLLILLIILVVFGANRIPQLGDALGKGIRNFRKSFAKDEIEAEPAHKEVREVPAVSAEPETPAEAVRTESAEHEPTKTG